ncbi:MAG: T9SS type A sorting domain-containing protein [Chitinophagales bacterium]|nr:T9SS type A sorting domain-containing protein [Chitinophagales bacterium]
MIRLHSLKLFFAIAMLAGIFQATNSIAQKPDLYCPAEVIYDRGFNNHTVYFTIFNSGANSSATTIDFYLSNDLISDATDPYIGNFNLPDMNEGDFLVDSFEFNICDAAFELDSLQQTGTCNLWLSIDPQNLIDESKEDNNIKFDSLAMSYDCALGIEEQKINQSINVYPSPSNGNIKISIADPSFQIINLELLDLEGRIISSINLEKSNQQFRNEFDFNFLENGIYLLHLSSGSQTFNSKVVIQK